MRYEAILELESKFSVTLLKKTAGVSRTAYYTYKKRKKKTSQIKNLCRNILWFREIHSLRLA